MYTEEGGTIPMNNTEKEQFAALLQRMESGELADQPCWSFVREMNSYSEERLESVAIRDGYREYTYRQMFRYWERYAEAFSGMGISEKNHSRVGLITTPLTETVFAFYGLNMTGASISVIYCFDLFDDKQIESMIQREKITDLVISEYYGFPELMKRLLRDREKLGLRNVILLSSPMGGEFAMTPLEILRKANRDLFSEMDGSILMEDMLKKYEGYPISYGSGKSAVIPHTTGTVSGMHKPVPLTDRAMNAFVLSAIEARDTFEDFKDAPKQLITLLALNTSWVYALVDMMHTPLGMGMELVCVPFGATNPRYSDVIQQYGINVVFSGKSVLDSWLKSMPDADLSKVKYLFLGGTYISPEYKKEFNSYMWSCGSTARIINGYGSSEVGGAALICPGSREDDAIGCLLPGFKAKILVEDENCYYDISDGPRTGVLLLHSPSMSTGKLDDEVFFTLDNIDGEDYYNTHDLVRVNEDGSLTCIGRSNQYFVNNSGVRFDAGLIENAVTSQPGIAACGLAPTFHKILHDNVPVLYVEMSEKGAGGLTVLRKALIQVFIKDGVLADTNLPSACVIVDSIPLNTGGKVDSKRLASGAVDGMWYTVKLVKRDDKVIDILLLPVDEGDTAYTGLGVPEELERDPYTILSDVYALFPKIGNGEYYKLLKVPGLRELILKLTNFDIKNIPDSVRNMTPKMLNLALEKYLKPIMKGVPIMSKKQSFPQFQGIMPMPVIPVMMPVPFMPFPWNNQDSGEGNTACEDFGAGLMNAWKQANDVQKATMDGMKDQWNAFFENSMQMWDSIAETLPDELPALPGLPKPPVSPKKTVKQAKKLAEKVNKNLVEQADAVANIVTKQNEHVADMAATAGEIVKENMKATVATLKDKKEDKPAKDAVEVEFVEKDDNDSEAAAE